MSRQDVETLRHMYAALNDGDDGPLEDFLDHGFVHQTREELPGRGSYSRQEFLERLAELRETFSDIRFEPEEFIGSDQHVVVVVRGAGIGRVSGAPVEARLFHVWRIEDAKASLLLICSDRGLALESAGLGE